MTADTLTTSHLEVETWEGYMLNDMPGLAKENKQTKKKKIITSHLRYSLDEISR